MLLNPTPDQSLFRETTATFLDELVPVDVLRDLRDEPTGEPAKYWQRGAELGWTSLLVDEQHGGGAVGEHGLIDLTLIAHEFGRHAAPGTADADERRRRSAQPSRWRGPRRGGGGTRRRLVDRGVVPEGAAAARPSRRWVLDVRIEGDEVVLNGDEAARRRGPDRGSAPRHRTHRRRPHERARPERHAGCHDSAAAVDRPDAPLRRGRLRRRPGPAHRARRRCRWRGRRGRVGDIARPDDRRGRVGRGDGGGVRHDGRVGVRPVLVRPSAGVVPGAEAPVRRHAVVARRQPCDHRRGRGRRWPPTTRRRPISSSRGLRTSASTAPTWPTIACRSTAVSASRSNTTCTCTCGASSSTERRSPARLNTAAASPIRSSVTPNSERPTSRRWRVAS